MVVRRQRQNSVSRYEPDHSKSDTSDGLEDDQSLQEKEGRRVNVEEVIGGMQSDDSSFIF